MSFALTATSTRPATFGQSSPALAAAIASTRSPFAPVAASVAAAATAATTNHDEAPPAKRRRVEETHQTRARSITECLREQVVPHVVFVTRVLPESVYRTKAIAYKAVADLARTSWFRTRWAETNGYLPPQDEEEIKARVMEAVKLMKEDKEFLVQQDTETEIESVSTDSDESEEPQSESRQPLTQPQPQFQSATSQNQPPAFTGRRIFKLRKQQTGLRSNNKWFQLNHRPYRSAAERAAIAKGASRPIRPPIGFDRSDSQPTVYHVDFTPEEVSQIAKCLSKYHSSPVPATHEGLARLCPYYNIPTLLGNRLKGRSVEDIRNFCSDLLAGQTSSAPDDLRVLSISQENADNKRSEAVRASRIPSLLFAREIEGNAGFGRTRQYENIQNELKKAHEDGLQVVAEYTNCAGDITTGAWVSNDSWICGTTTHSDTHNQQYNKPGNLLLCSSTAGTLRAFPDHRIPRPIVDKGENSTDAMRQSQDPWLYSSVVSSDYDPINGLAYTSSFDKTVKAWKVEGQTMKALATWQHTGNVNFVAAAKDGSGRVATGADAPNSVRIYTIDRANPSQSTYQSFGCSRTDAFYTDKWAYFPATMQWGTSKWTHHLLLVGWSPRSYRGDDMDIPEEKRNSGEITLWDANQGRRIPVMTASTANVFEMLWHPTLPRFIVATTPTNFKVEPGVRTQVHVFQLDQERDDGGYQQYQALDCLASDINELTVMPNSFRHAYITAACTDGKVYVWDTALGDQPIHILKHGDPLEEPIGDREKEDTGVKFTAWGTSPDRFYTGSSDGVVKVWNVRKRRSPFIRDLLEAPGPISFGAFSPDSSKLAVGDATGRLYMLSVDKRDEPESHSMIIPGTTRRVRRPRPYIPHPEPPPPDAEVSDQADSIGAYTRQTYLDSQQLVLSGNPVIGAVQGPRYASTALFRREAHRDLDPNMPLLADFERLQRESEASSRGTRRRSMRRLRAPASPNTRLTDIHTANTERDLDIEALGDDEMRDLVRAGALLTVEEDWGFAYEEMPEI